MLMSFTSQCAIGLLPKPEGIGFRIILFEACSTFTRVLTRMVAESSKTTRLN